MRIGIDLSVLAEGKRTGIGNYAYFLVRELLKLDTEHEFVLFVRNPNLTNPPEFTEPKFRSGHSGTSSDSSGRYKIAVLPKKKVPFWTRHYTHAKIFKREKLDILHCPANTLPLFWTGKSVITIHDLAIYKYPDWFPRGQWLSTKVVVPRSIRKADKIIVPSEITKRDLMELFKVPVEKIVVIPHGVDERFFIRNPNLTNPPEFAEPGSRSEHSDKGSDSSGRYLLSVGTDPRKNLRRLIEAYEQLPEGMKKEYELWIAGNPQPSLRGVAGVAISLRSPRPDSEIRPRDDRSGHIKFLNYVSDEDLPVLYQNASLFVYPSLYEGFGLPVLEAVAAGTPAIVSTAIARNFQLNPKSQFSSSPFLTVNPYSVQEIRDAILRCLRDKAYCSKISDVGQELAKYYTWERTARETLRVYGELGQNF